MAIIRFQFDGPRFFRLVAYLKSTGFQFRSASLHKCRDDIDRVYTFESEVDYPLGNGHFKLFPIFTWFETSAIYQVNNIHQGKMFSLASGGGPYLELLFYVSKSECEFRGDIELKPRFSKMDATIVAPDAKLRQAFLDLKKFVLAELRQRKTSK